MDGESLKRDHHGLPITDGRLGKYVGNRPVKLKKADNNINPVEIGHRKARQLEKELKKNRHKPY